MWQAFATNFLANGLVAKIPMRYLNVILVALAGWFLWRIYG